MSLDPDAGVVTPCLITDADLMEKAGKVTAAALAEVGVEAEYLGGGNVAVPIDTPIGQLRKAINLGRVAVGFPPFDYGGGAA